jgi:hypothetical protein
MSVIENAIKRLQAARGATDCRWSAARTPSVARKGLMLHT